MRKLQITAIGEPTDVLELVEFQAPAPGPGQVLFFAGDDHAVNAEFATFGEALGFAPVLLGGLREGGRLMQLDGPLSALHVVKQD